MSAYLRYIVQRADSSFLYDKYQNQSIAAHVMRALAAEQSEVSPEQRRAICEAFESANNTHGLNLTAHKYPAYAAHYKPHPLTVTQLWKLLHYYPLLIRQWKATATGMITVQVLGWPKRNFTIISISMTAMSIFYEPVNVEYFAMNNWSFLQSGSIGIDRKDIEKGIYRAYRIIEHLPGSAY